MPDPVPAAPPLPAAFLAAPIAHRGLHDRRGGVIENSRGAALAAIAAGCGIECDIQPAADGTPMVFHDDDLDRLTSHAGPITARPAADLATTPLVGAAAGETIPTLAEFLALVAGRAPLLIEIKDQDGALGPRVGALEARVAALLTRYPGPVAVMSFNPYSVAAMAKAAPDVPRGLTTCAFGEEWPLDPTRRGQLAALADFDAAGAAFISHDHADLANPAVAALSRRGVPILTWTIRSPEQEAAARRLADNVTFEGYRPAIRR